MKYFQIDRFARAKEGFGTKGKMDDSSDYERVEIKF